MDRTSYPICTLAFVNWHYSQLATWYRQWAYFAQNENFANSNDDVCGNIHFQNIDMLPFLLLTLLSNVSLGLSSCSARSQQYIHLYQNYRLVQNLRGSFNSTTRQCFAHCTRRSSCNAVSSTKNYCEETSLSSCYFHNESRLEPSYFIKQVL